jgi:tripartite-type tricarboxylate transporter receptor subunit TctC
LILIQSCPGISFWQALWVPKGTLKDIVSRLNSAAVSALVDPAVRQKLTDLGQDVYSMNQQMPEALGITQR